MAAAVGQVWWQSGNLRGATSSFGQDKKSQGNPQGWNAENPTWEPEFSLWVQVESEAKE